MWRIIASTMLLVSTVSYAPPHTLYLRGQVNESWVSVTKHYNDVQVKILKINPRVVFTSDGGLVSSNFKVYNIMKEWRNLTTIVADSCSSACSDLFLMGHNRYMGEGSYMVVHQQSSCFLGTEFCWKNLTPPYSPEARKMWYHTQYLYQKYTKPVLTKESQIKWEAGIDVVIWAKPFNQGVKQ